MGGEGEGRERKGEVERGRRKNEHIVNPQPVLGCWGSAEEVAHASQSVIHMSFMWRIRPYKFVHGLQPEFNLIIMLNCSILNEHSFRRGALATSLGGQEASEILLESSERLRSPRLK